jgi:hypothetical protein
MNAFAERSRIELEATEERARKRNFDTLDVDGAGCADLTICNRYAHFGARVGLFVNGPP